MTHITIERAKAQRIADAFEDLRKNYGISYIEESVDINQALAAQPAPVQEPVGIKGYAMALNEVALKLRDRYKNDVLSTPLWAEFEKARNKFASSVATPPAAQRQWVGLTDDDYVEMGISLSLPSWQYKAIEAKLRSKNT
jgi:hypothetical protein